MTIHSHLYLIPIIIVFAHDFFCFNDDSSFGGGGVVCIHFDTMSVCGAGLPDSRFCILHVSLSVRVSSFSRTHSQALNKIVVSACVHTHRSFGGSRVCDFGGGVAERVGRKTTTCVSPRAFPHTHGALSLLVVRRPWGPSVSTHSGTQTPSPTPSSPSQVLYPLACNS